MGSRHSLLNADYLKKNSFIKPNRLQADNRASMRGSLLQSFPRLDTDTFLNSPMDTLFVGLSVKPDKVEIAVERCLVIARGSTIR